MWGSAFRHNNRGCGLQKLQVPSVPSIWIVWRLDTPNSNGKLAIISSYPQWPMFHPHGWSWTVGGLASLRNVGSKQALKPPASWCRKIYFHLYYMHLCVFCLCFSWTHGILPLKPRHVPTSWRSWRQVNFVMSSGAGFMGSPGQSAWLGWLGWLGGTPVTSETSNTFRSEERTAIMMGDDGRWWEMMGEGTWTPRWPSSKKHILSLNHG